MKMHATLGTAKYRQLIDAYSLAWRLRKAGVTAAEVPHISQTRWQQISADIGVRPPNAATILQVAELVREIENAGGIVEGVDGRVYCRQDESGIISHGTSTSISINRMYPHSTGYELVRDVPVGVPND